MAVIGGSILMIGTADFAAVADRQAFGATGMAGLILAGGAALQSGQMVRLARFLSQSHPLALARRSTLSA
ncbi:hypothetical protein H261_10854 [Paramagnetospirillum caucaseum]|uniref:Uncharacterized protein n=1 Tax=Paramagnetospirillum caucaseum TaxID=1244869 RepID=M3AAS4_9PROT|nr:hypothetical protein H261_10854 [Paramagnetospirillum caucaseum]